MELHANISQFLKRYKSFLVSKPKDIDWHYIYNQANREIPGWTSDLTALLFKQGVYPHNYMTYIPDNYAAGLYTEGLITLHNKIKSIEQYALASTDLHELYIPDSLTKIGPLAFDDCTELTEVLFNDTSSLASIGKEAFRGCTSLSSIVIPPSVKAIGKGAFSFSGLTSITLPDEVILASGIFEFTNLKTIYYKGSMEDWKLKGPRMTKTTFKGCPHVTVECNDGSIYL